MYNLLLGIVGMIFIVVAFVLDEWIEKFNQNTLSYNILNVIGSLLLLYYAFTLRGWPFVVLNLIWFGNSILKIASLLSPHKVKPLERKTSKL